MSASIASEDGDAGFQIAPMVDVVFVLMLFFMAAAGSQVLEKELAINLPGQSVHSEPTLILIQSSAEGEVTMNDRSFGAPNRNLDDLRDWLKNVIETYGTSDAVVIRPNSQTRHDRIIDVLSAAASAGVKNLSFN